MAQVKVGIIGGGIVGPVIATLLKQQGYEPIIFERNDSVPEGGIGIGIQTNGLAVLQRIPGLIDTLGGRYLDYFNFYSVLPEDPGLLGALDAPKKRREATGAGTLGVRRSALQHALVAAAARAGVDVRWGHHLTALAQYNGEVVLTFANGARETVAFAVGCDGLHSDTRKALFGEERADYTGLCQIGGYAPMPASFEGKSMAMNVFGDGAHMITVPVGADTVGWAVTTREAEAKETWRAMDAAAADAFKNNSPMAQWGYGAGEIVRNAQTLTKYGLYDRPELPTWHAGRVVLIGDAAHPTSPHLGQGANQAFEDAALLADLLAQHNPPPTASPSLSTPSTPSSPSSAPPPNPPTPTLEAAFAALEGARIPRTAALVKKAREQGETRVVHGVPACLARNQWYRELLGDEAALRARFAPPA
ncbi:FAD/NAD(P)-binding domain-containing protein [Phanerochaete sordida]|uniref:FAD/NAD(P)-binding domain-containing protein n=1 Tax=Phanerochaete sordida TaxID=48140 RepID=A0A9P3GK45_9APHY|nr:FAD/NAD(P)-binding domain-containing protein [Phanerochaete sordida]